jgi:hypothetical protein
VFWCVSPVHSEEGNLALNFLHGHSKPHEKILPVNKSKYNFMNYEHCVTNVRVIGRLLAIHQNAFSVSSPT